MSVFRISWIGDSELGSVDKQYGRQVSGGGGGPGGGGGRRWSSWPGCGLPRGSWDTLARAKSYCESIASFCQWFHLSAVLDFYWKHWYLYQSSDRFCRCHVSSLSVPFLYLPVIFQTKPDLPYPTNHRAHFTLLKLHIHSSIRAGNQRCPGPQTWSIEKSMPDRLSFLRVLAKVEQQGWK